MDVVKVHEAAQKAIELVRSGNGPYLLEASTYRFRGHSMGDPERYRKQEEVKRWEESDPIGIYRKYLNENKVATDKVLDEMDAQVMVEVQNAVEFAETSPEPGLEELYKDIYAD
jgi:pyruvate dehydrogenase E1 component alpha subunit